MNRYPFLKSQTVSLVATATDFLVTIILKEIFGFLYILAHASGLFCGGLTQFALNRRWTFQKESRNNKMVIRFLLVWTNNFVLNTSIVWCLTNILQWDFIVSKIITATVMAVTINFFLQKEYVFK